MTKNEILSKIPEDGFIVWQPKGREVDDLVFELRDEGKLILEDISCGVLKVYKVRLARPSVDQWFVEEGRGDNWDSCVYHSDKPREARIGGAKRRFRRDPVLINAEDHGKSVDQLREIYGVQEEPVT